MKITILGSGTSQGVPVIACDCEVCRSLDWRDQRLRVSIYIEVENTHLVVDTGPDFRTQMIKNRVSKLDAVLFTHEHKDHTAGMDDLRSFNFKLEKDIPIYARASVMEQLKQEFSYIFVDKEKKYPGVLNVVENLIENKPFKINEVEILPIEGLHHKLAVFGFRIKDFIYLTDVNAVSEIEKEKMKNAKVLIVGALQKETHISHFSLQQALNFIHELKPEKAYITHISHKMGRYMEIQKELPDNIFLAYDGLQIVI
ncbi:MAG: MBL fold metallo-hydrolase [Bacteroidetes bacterium]|nr:MAG: MBL fold metallo-hydrolase [Bacteroidota bacterium]